MTTTIETWMPEARQIAAQCWCDKDTELIEMDVVLAEAVAKRIAAWMETAAFHARNEAYWRDRARKAEEASKALHLLREACGHIQDGSHEHVTIPQDDATGDWVVAVGSNGPRFTGPSFMEAMEDMVAAEENKND